MSEFGEKLLLALIAFLLGLLADGISTESEEVAPGIVLDFDEHNRVVGIEIEDASKFIDLSRLELRALPVVNLVFSERVPA
jgi:uncharacterized protein YuzE